MTMSSFFTFQITKRICEEQLLTVRGLVSFTFDMTKSRCIVRARPDTTAEIICQTVNKTKVLSAQQIVKNERGEEVSITAGLGNNVSWFVHLQETWLGNNVSWFVHLLETWLGNNVSWFMHLQETWLGNNVYWFVHLQETWLETMFPGLSTFRKHG